MLFAFLLCVLITAACNVFALLVFAGDLRSLRKHYKHGWHTGPPSPPPAHARPTRRDLDLQLDILQFRLQRKQLEIETGKSSVLLAATGLQKLDGASQDVVKYYRMLQAEIERTQADCERLQAQIVEKRRRRDELAAAQLRSQEHAMVGELAGIHAHMDSYSKADTHAKREACLIDFICGEGQQAAV